MDNIQTATPSRSVPTGVKVIGWLYMIFSILGILGGIMLLVGGTAILGASIEGEGGGVLAAIMGFGAVVVLIIGIVGFLAGLKLNKGKNWARILIIVLSVLAVLSALVGMVSGNFSGIVSLIINGLIGGYLWFNAAVKAAFNV